VANYLKTCWKVIELQSGQGNRKRRGGGRKPGKCVIACGQLLRVFFLTQNMQESSSLLGKVLHIEHSCHSDERMYAH